MPVLALADAAALLPDRGVLLGLDLGSRTIGVAASDPDRRVAAPVETISRKRFALDAGHILALAAETRAVDPRFCPQSGAFDRAADCALGRAVVDRRRRARVDCGGRQPCDAQKRYRSARRRLYPTRRARPASPRTTDKLVKNGPVHRTTRRSDPSRVPRRREAILFVMSPPTPPRLIAVSSAS